MVFHCSLSDSKSPQVSRTLLSILADLNNAIVPTVSTRLVISKSSSPCTNALVTEPRAPITRLENLSLFSHSFNFIKSSDGPQRPQFYKFSPFFMIIRSGRLPEIRWSVLSQNPRRVCVSHSLKQIVDCAYTICSHGQTLISCTIPNGSPCPPSGASSCIFSLMVCCICLLCNWSFRLYHHITTPPDCYILSIIALIWLVLMLFWAAIRNYCRSADLHVASIISVGCNQSSSALFYVIFDLFIIFIVFHISSDWCIFIGIRVIASLVRFPWFF